MEELKMEPIQVPENLQDDNLNLNNENIIESTPINKGIIIPQEDYGESKCGCSGGSKSLSYIFAIGKIEFHYPNTSVAEWILQEVKNQSANNSGKTDDEVLYEVLRDNQYL